MNGQNFYISLLNFYNTAGKHLYGNYSFSGWLQKNNSRSFQFNGKTQKKSIPQSWLVAAKDAQNNGTIITREWFNNQFNESNCNDCRASVAMWLLKNHC